MIRRGRHSPAPCLILGLALLIVQFGCGSRSHPAGDARSRLPGEGDVTSHDSLSVPDAEARERDVLAALPLARHGQRLIRSADGTTAFTFDGFFSDGELICVKALPPPQGDTSGVTTYVYDRGRLLSVTDEIRTPRSTNGPREFVVHALFGPDGTVLEFDMTRDGERRQASPRVGQIMLQLSTRMAKEAYDEVLSHDGK